MKPLTHPQLPEAKTSPFAHAYHLLTCRACLHLRSSTYFDSPSLTSQPVRIRSNRVCKTGKWRPENRLRVCEVCEPLSEVERVVLGGVLEEIMGGGREEIGEGIV